MFEKDENIKNHTEVDSKMSYEEALNELQTTLSNIDQPETKLDDLQANVQRANLLIQHCKDKLRAIEKNVKNIL